MAEEEGEKKGLAKRLTCFSVLSEDQVSVVQGCYAAHMGAFFPVVGHVKGNPPLAIQRRVGL